ncbi:ATP-dependent RNA helicase TDRD9 [Plecturocebus cupreus]
MPVIPALWEAKVGGSRGKAEGDTEQEMLGQKGLKGREGPRSSLPKLSNVTSIPGTTYKYPDLPINRCKEERSTYCSIVVTQPRKIGASSIARWISKERAWTLGGVVGYQVGLEKIATEDTRLIYMTTGVLLQKIVSAKSLMEFTHIIIDEVSNVIYL